MRIIYGEEGWRCSVLQVRGGNVSQRVPGELSDFLFVNIPPILCCLVHYSYLMDMSRFNEDLVGASPSFVAAGAPCLARDP